MEKILNTNLIALASLLVRGRAPAVCLRGPVLHWSRVRSDPMYALSSGPLVPTGWQNVGAGLVRQIRPSGGAVFSTLLHFNSNVFCFFSVPGSLSNLSTLYNLGIVDFRSF